LLHVSGVPADHKAASAADTYDEVNC
jgi:hypothetical protein